jgi:hypothetical protein
MSTLKNQNGYACSRRTKRVYLARLPITAKPDPGPWSNAYLGDVHGGYIKEAMVGHPLMRPFPK